MKPTMDGQPPAPKGAAFYERRRKAIVSCMPPDEQIDAGFEIFGKAFEKHGYSEFLHNRTIFCYCLNTERDAGLTTALRPQLPRQN